MPFVSNIIKTLAPIAGVLGFIAVLFEFYSLYEQIEEGYLRSFLFFVSLASFLGIFGVAFSSIVKFYFNPLPADVLSEAATENLDHYMPKETVNVLKYFLESILKQIITHMGKVTNLNNINLYDFTRAFSIVGRDVIRIEEYKWSNLNDQPLLDIPILAFGGNIQTFNETRSRAWEVINNKEYECQITPIEIIDRVLVLNISLNQNRRRELDNTIFFADRSAGSMLPEWDMVFIAQTAFFRNQIGKIHFYLEADRVIEGARIYSLSLITGKREIVKSEIVQNKEGRSLEISVRKPNTKSIYFVVFKRL